ncbi:RusA family crossover junction endodeoxyribonuclease [bacterium]|jgi:Holliday junction resolvase RusA-like endonuclease|nr:RusA family crossover junction endodeoxyribonuclease [bacterium]
MFKFTIYGKPQGKGRPRITTRGGFAHAYSSKQTVDYEKLIKEEWLKHYSDTTPLKSAIYLQINAYYKIPTSFKKADKEQARLGVLRPFTKPDFDNIEKIIADALNKLAYNDDVQITTNQTKRRYSTEPRVEVLICEDNTP